MPSKYKNNVLNSEGYEKQVKPDIRALHD